MSPSFSSYHTRLNWKYLKPARAHCSLHVTLAICHITLLSKLHVHNFLQTTNPSFFLFKWVIWGSTFSPQTSQKLQLLFLIFYTCLLYIFFPPVLLFFILYVWLGLHIHFIFVVRGYWQLRGDNCSTIIATDQRVPIVVLVTCSERYKKRKFKCMSMMAYLKIVYFVVCHYHENSTRSHVIS